MVKYKFMLTFMCFFVIKSSYGESVAVYGSIVPKFEAIKSGGLRITVPDGGFKSVTFNGFLNRTIETKQWQMYVPKAKNGVWVMLDRNLKLKLNDVIKYSISVMINGQKYQIQGDWTVIEFVDEDNLECPKSDTVIQCGKRVCKGELIFSEEFTGDIEDLKSWTIEKMFPQEPDYPFNAYLPEPITLEDGNLKIKPILTSESDLGSDFIYKRLDINEDCTGQVATPECYQVGSGAQIITPVISGKISTRSNFNFKYGRIEVRAKLPVGDWLIPEINLEPRDHEYGRLHYGSGLIRIACVKGNKKFSNTLHGGAMFRETEPHRSMFLKYIESKGEIWGQDFHNYTLTWKPESIELFVDGQQYGTMELSSDNSNPADMDDNFRMQMSAYSKGSPNAPLDKMFYISLGVRVGGIHDFEDSREKPWKNKSPKAMLKFWENMHSWHRTWNSPELLVDYVKVYAL